MLIFKTSGNRRQRRLSFLIIIVAVMLSGYLMFSGNGGEGKNGAVSLGQNAGSDLSVIDPSLDFSIKPLDNLTSQFTDQALKDLVKKNQNLANTKNLKGAKLLPDPQNVNQIVSDIIDNQIKEVGVSDSDISVNADNSKDIQRVYLVFINGLIKDGLSSVASQNIGDAPADQYFSNVASQLKRIADILTVVNVPPSWKDVHKQLISFFLTQENVFQSLGAANADPIRFMIASNRVLSQEIDAQFSKIKDAINKKIKNEGLI